MRGVQGDVGMIISLQSVVKARIDNMEKDMEFSQYSPQIQSGQSGHTSHTTAENTKTRAFLLITPGFKVSHQKNHSV